MSRLPRRLAGGALATAAIYFVCCVLPVLLVGGGTAAITAGIVRESLIIIPLGLIMIGAGVGYTLIRRASARRRTDAG